MGWRAGAGGEIAATLGWTGGRAGRWWGEEGAMGIFYNGDWRLSVAGAGMFYGLCAKQKRQEPPQGREGAPRAIGNNRDQLK